MVNNNLAITTQQTRKTNLEHQGKTKNIETVAVGTLLQCEAIQEAMHH
jgi:hypothetical protein